MNIESVQRQHYNSIADQYAAHYGDPYSQLYRQKFIYDRLFWNSLLSGQRVLEAMCGSGEATGYLLEKGAKVIGLDISTAETANFNQRWPQSAAACASILNSGFVSESFDSIVVIGGLHHLHPRVSQAIEELYRLLKVGGRLYLCEPHAASLADRVRRLWYRRDPLFAENEASIDMDRFQEEYSGRFRFHRFSYHGNIAYLLVFNSLILRIPLAAKKYYALPLLRLESLLSRFETKLWSCFVLVEGEKI